MDEIDVLCDPLRSATYWQENARYQSRAARAILFNSSKTMHGVALYHLRAAQEFSKNARILMGIER